MIQLLLPCHPPVEALTPSLSSPAQERVVQYGRKNKNECIWLLQEYGTVCARTPLV